MSYVPDSMFRQITQNNWIAIVFSDTKGIITYVNDAAYKLYGYDDGELLGKPSAVLAVDDVNIPVVLQEILQKGGWSGEMPQKKKDGTTFTALLTVWLTYDENNVPTGMSSNCMDISERKIMEVEIQKLNEELEHKIQKRTSQLQTSNAELAKAKAIAEQALEIQKQF